MVDGVGLDAPAPQELGETRPLTAPQTKALVASLEKVAKKAPSDSMKKAAERAKARYAK